MSVQPAIVQRTHWYANTAAPPTQAPVLAVSVPPSAAVPVTSGGPIEIGPGPGGSVPAGSDGFAVGAIVGGAVARRAGTSSRPYLLSVARVALLSSAAAICAAVA